MFVTDTQPFRHRKNFLDVVIMIKNTHIKVVAQWTGWQRIETNGAVKLMLDGCCSDIRLKRKMSTVS